MDLIPFTITKNSVVLLRSDRGVVPILLIKAGGINLPIGFNVYEAQRIVTLVLGGEPSWCSPDDLARNVLVVLGSPLTKIVIVGISDECNFLARIFFKKGEEEFSLPAHLSDAIVLGLSFKVPMFVGEKVLIEGTSNEGTEGLLSAIQEFAPHTLEI